MTPRAAADANLLPRDGRVRYLGPLFERSRADEILRQLLDDIPWRHDEVRMFGKTIVTARQVAWYGDKDFAYTYSGSTRRAAPWTPLLAELRGRVRELAGADFNSCLLNLYHHGGEGMSWHSDDEATLVPDASIASLSFGAERRFSFRHKQTRETVRLDLGHGSLLLMEGSTQRHWQHALPKSRRVSGARANLTFRRMKDRQPSRVP